MLQHVKLYITLMLQYANTLNLCFYFMCTDREVTSYSPKLETWPPFIVFWWMIWWCIQSQPLVSMSLSLIINTQGSSLENLRKKFTPKKKKKEFKEKRKEK